MTTKSRFEKEFKDVLDVLSKKKRSAFQKANRERMFLTRKWAQRHGKRKSPKWVSHVYSHHKRPIMAMRGWYFFHGFAVRTRVTKTKTGKKKYWLDLYDSVARKLK